MPRRLHLFCAPTRKGCLGGGEGKREVLRPPNPEKAALPPPHPAASSAHPRAEPKKPTSDGAGVVIAKKCPLHLNFPTVSLACTASPGPPRFSRAILQAPPPPFLPSLLPACPRRNPKGTAEKEQWAWGPPACQVPQSPPKPSPAPGTLDYPNECHSGLGTSVAGVPGCLSRVPVRSCSPSLSASLRPSPRLGSTPGHLGRAHFASSRGGDCSKTGQHKGQKVEERTPLVSRIQLANSPSPAPTPGIPTATFSLPSWFPLGCGEQSRGR